MEEYVGGHNQNPKPFIWTATASDILEKVQRARKKLDKVTVCLTGTTSEEKLEGSKSKAADAVGSTEKALLGAVVRWLQNECDSYTSSALELQEIKERVNERTQLVKELVSKISTFQNELAAELRQRSERIRSDAVSIHVSTIQEAADAVEQLREMLARIAEEARSATIS